MAKIAFTKLGLKKNEEVDSFEWNEQTIEVKQYLPIEEKLELVTRIINNSVDDNGYYNPARVYVNTIIEVCLTYTNINLTEKQREDIYKLYDLLAGSGFSARVIGEEMNPYEFNQVRSWVEETITQIYKYKNSALGLLDIITSDYKNTALNIEELQDKISDPESLALLKDVLSKLG